MGNRILKESIKKSPTIDQLSWFEEVMFYRIVVTADDYGRLDGRITVLKNDLFPTKETITKKQVEDALEKLIKVGLVCRYMHNDVPYLYLPSWESHQQVRAHKSKFPAPDIACNQMISDDSKCVSNPIQYESNTNPNPIQIRCADFGSFWNAYPRKTAKQAAQKAWDKLKPDDALLAIMLSAIDTQKKSAAWTKDGGQFIPHPATWLNGRRWEDEVRTKPEPPKPRYSEEF